jgi:chorismate dehydratase
LGVVSYLNAKPLIAGLEADPDVALRFEVPSRLPALLAGGEVDAALVPVIDLLAHARSWQIVSDACLGCDGETLTVRVFSRVAAGSVRRLHVDGDSHTSVALARIIWAELHGRALEIRPYAGRETEDCEAVLLIGDKVVNNNLIECDIETDLGAAWKTLTGLPFVFAVWAAPRELSLGDLPARLSQARDRGIQAAELIAADLGPGLGWPVALAKRYLTTRLRYHLGEMQRRAIARFHELARGHGIVQSDRELLYA